MKYLLPFASIGVGKYKKKPRISLIYKAFWDLVRFLLILFSDPVSGKRDSDPRPQPWQGCALPTELFPHYITNFPFRESLTFYSRGFIHPPPDVCEPCNLEESLSLSDCECKDMSKKLFSKTFVIFFAILF